jgi:hypothetical protein
MSQIHGQNREAEVMVAPNRIVKPWERLPFGKEKPGEGARA